MPPCFTRCNYGVSVRHYSGWDYTARNQRTARRRHGPTAREATVTTVALTAGTDVEAACAGPLAQAPKQA